MKKVIDYLTKQGATFEAVRYGSSYFYNADSVKVDAVSVIFNFGENTATIERKIKAYCKRYGYIVAFEGFNFHCSYFTIFKPSDHNSYMLYSDFEEKSRKECEVYMHSCYSTGCKPDNNTLRRIMNKWGLLYNTRLDVEKAC